MMHDYFRKYHRRGEVGPRSCRLTFGLILCRGVYILIHVFFSASHSGMQGGFPPAAVSGLVPCASDPGMLTYASRALQCTTPTAPPSMATVPAAVGPQSISDNQTAAEKRPNLEPLAGGRRKRRKPQFTQKVTSSAFLHRSSHDSD